MATSTSAPRLKRSASSRDDFTCGPTDSLVLNVVICGASGDLAKKKTYPALFALHVKGFLPKRVNLIGYARSVMTSDELRARIKPFLKGSEAEVSSFLSVCSYCKGDYDSASSGYEDLLAAIKAFEGSCPDQQFGRLFYLALPPNVYPQVCGGLKRVCSDVSSGKPGSWIRVIVEKPFGHDLASSEVLAGELGALFSEEVLYRIDHYLGKELTQNIMVMRFCNPLFGSWWSRQYVSNVQVTFKEPFGTQGRGGYFDQYGIIRDVIQNHLLQVLALITMELPVSKHPDDIRDEKVKVLRCIPSLGPEDCILGQYTAGNGEPGYLEDPTVPKGSRTPTFAACRMYINNERWAGVPFIIKAGKALNERVALVRIQLSPAATHVFGDTNVMRNEFVVKLQPGESLYAKMVVKKPGLELDTEMSELDLSYSERYHDVSIPDAYERLILDAIRGDQQHFVRRDELRAAWAIFTPLLHAIDAGRVDLETYVAGSRGPASMDKFLEESGYVQPTKYVWKPKSRQQ